MAIFKASLLFASLLLVGLMAPALDAQDPVIGGTANALPGAAIAPPAPPVDNPPRVPKVTCDGDQLKISANNATLVSVLAAVHACIGVQIDIPAGAGEARTFEELGPGPAREVLESLLSGTDFNYAIGSSDADPGKVQTVLLMERTKESAAADAASQDRPLTAGRRSWIEAMKRARSAGATGDDSSPSADDPSDSPAVDDANAAPPAPPADNADPSAAQPPVGDSAPPASDAPPASPAATLSPAGSSAYELPPSVGLTTDTGKSTSDRITDMQQMFQQRRQMSQTQAPAPAQPQQ